MGWVGELTHNYAVVMQMGHNSQTHTKKARLSQGCHKVATRLYTKYKVVTTLYEGCHRYDNLA